MEGLGVDWVKGSDGATGRKCCGGTGGGATSVAGRLGGGAGGQDGSCCWACFVSRACRNVVGACVSPTNSVPKSEQMLYSNALLSPGNNGGDFLCSLQPCVQSCHSRSYTLLYPCLHRSTYGIVACNPMRTPFVSSPPTSLSRCARFACPSSAIAAAICTYGVAFRMMRALNLPMRRVLSSLLHLHAALCIPAHPLCVGDARASLAQQMACWGLWNRELRHAACADPCSLMHQQPCAHLL